VRRDEHVLGRGAGGHDLLHLRDTGTVLDHRHHDHDHRRTQGLVALGVQHLRAGFRVARLQPLGEQFAKAMPGVAAHDEKLPGAQPAMVGRAKAGGEDLLDQQWIGLVRGQPRR
jgi:hypothetical protein